VAVTTFVDRTTPEEQLEDYYSSPLCIGPLPQRGDVLPPVAKLQKLHVRLSSQCAGCTVLSSLTA
jgi:hypothetical protein